MSYCKKYIWEIKLTNLPVVKKNCPKCKIKTHFINTKKFRINANKNNLDIWMIYQCEKCKSTWNMTIYERVNPSDINKSLYNRFLLNDSSLAEEYGFNFDLYNKNKAEVLFDNIEYNVIKDEEIDYNLDEFQVEIKAHRGFNLRVDKLLSDNTKFSRNKIKEMSKNNNISINDNCNILKNKVKNGMVIHIKNCK